MYPCCTLLGPKEPKFWQDMIYWQILTKEKQPRHAQPVHSTPNPSPPEDEEALTLVRCRETSLRGKRDPCSFWTWMKTSSHWFWAVHPKLWKGSVRCLLTRNRQHIFALAEVLSALPVFLDLIWPCILHCLYSCTNGCSSKRNRSCTEIPAQNQPLCLVLFCGPSLVGSSSWQVFISKLVHDLAHSHFLAMSAPWLRTPLSFLGFQAFLFFLFIQRSERILKLQRFRLFRWIICWDSDQLLLCFCHGLCNGFLSQKNKSSKWGFYGFGIFKLWNLKNGRNKSVCKIRPYRISAKSPCLWILQAACWEFRSRLLDLRNNASP